MSGSSPPRAMMGQAGVCPFRVPMPQLGAPLYHLDKTTARIAALKCRRTVGWG